MNFKGLIILLFLSLVSNKIHAGEKIPVMDFDAFESYLQKDNDTIYVINFWATWCVPCRKELPEFEKIHLDYQDEAIKVLLVSLDFPNRLETSLIPFLKEKNITSSVILLNDPDSNSWINKVDSSWSGALPATVIYSREIKYFYEEELDYEKISHTIHLLTNQKR